MGITHFNKGETRIVFTKQSICMTNLSRRSARWGLETSIYCLSARCWDTVQNKACKTKEKFLCWTAVYSLDEVKRGKRKILCWRIFCRSHKVTKLYHALDFTWFSLFNVNKSIAKPLSAISFLNCLWFNTWMKFQSEAVAFISWRCSHTIWLQIK